VAVAVVAAVPLALDPWGAQRAGPLRWAVLVALVPLGLAAACRAGWAVLPAGRRWGALLAVVVLAAALGVAPLSGVIGGPRRGLGVLAWAVWAGAFALGASLWTPAARRAVAAGALAASIAVSGYGLVQVVELDPLTWEAGLDVDRARSTWANASVLGGYLVVIVPLGVALAADGTGSRWWRRLGAAAATLGALTLVATQARGAWLAAVVGLAWWAWRRWPARQRVLVASAAAVLAVVVVAAVAAEGSRGTAGGRLDTWRLTTEVIAARPVLGGGPDSLRTTLLEVVDDGFEREHGSDELHDRAHNLVLDTLATVGIAGAGALVVLAAGVAPLLRRGAAGSPLAAGIAAGALGYVVHLQFAFQDPALDAVVWLLVGVGVAPAVRAAPRRPAAAWLAGLLLVVAVAAFGWAAREVPADRALDRGLDALADGDLAAATAELDRAARWVPERVLYRQALGRARLAQLERGGDVDAGRRAVADVDRALDLAPGDGELLLDRAAVVVTLAQLGDVDPVDAEKAARRALDAYPASSRGHRILGIALALGGRSAEADAAWTRAADLDPDDVDALHNLARLRNVVGDGEGASAAYEAILDRHPADPVARAALGLPSVSDPAGG
jgi:O-antigen ligase